jgi:signal transduction histidine kinase
VVELNSPMLRAEDLAEALQWLITRMAERYSLKVELSLHGHPRIPDKDIQALLLQMTRELLFNIVKHAGVNQARLDVRQQDGLIKIRVEDQGKGFDPQEMRAHQGKQGGFGLLTMQERLAFIGGHLEIVSAPGQGSRITIIAPVEPAK